MIRQSLVNPKNENALAVIDDGRHFSRGEIARMASAVGRLLPKVGRANVAIFLPDGAPYIAALWGVIMCGHTAFPLSTRLTRYEIMPLLEQASVQMVITSRVHLAHFENGFAPLILVEDLPEAGGVETRWADQDEPMILLATSGTTGRAKIVQLSQNNVAASTRGYLKKMDYGDADVRYALGTPFSSAYGLLILTACMLKSFPIVVLKEGFTLDALYRAAQAHRITHFEGGVSVGLLMDRLAGRPIDLDISSLRYFALAGSKISGDVLRRLMAAYPGIEFRPGYGMTEAGPLIAKPDRVLNMEKLDAVGTKIDGISVLIEADGVRTDAPHVRGEVIVKGPNVMLGYLGNEDATRSAIKDGYLYTGDIGFLDAEGYLSICGRKKNVIIVRGFNVHAEEVEACILESGLAKDAVVYGAADALDEEAVLADVVPADGASAALIDQYCRTHLADYKRPSKINVVADIKKTATGKSKRAQKGRDSK